MTRAVLSADDRAMVEGFLNASYDEAIMYWPLMAKISRAQYLVANRRFARRNLRWARWNGQQWTQAMRERCGL